MKHIQFTKNQLSSLYDFYKNELSGNDYYEENGQYYLNDYQNGFVLIGDINDVIKDFEFLKVEYTKENNRIKNATAIYTGGGIYIYYGQLNNGLFFRACDDWDFIEICDSDTSVEDADYYEFYEIHSVDTWAADRYKTFWNDMLLWIIHNTPKGNYIADELEGRLLGNE